MIEMPGTRYRGMLPPADDDLKSLAEELRRDVHRLAVKIGERNVRHRPRELALAADAIAVEFASDGYDVRRQTYEVETVECVNLDVEVPGSGPRAGEIIIVGAHYDTVPGSPGANDNTSGVAATLALAQHFAGRKLDRTLRFAAFVNEEAPYGHTEQMGSRVYARRCRVEGENVAGMLSLETIGYFDDRPGSQKYPPPIGPMYPREGNFIAVVGNLTSAALVQEVVAAFRAAEPFPCEGAALPDSIGRIADSDHSSFWHEGYPALMITDTANFRYPYYHTPEDTIDKIDFDRLARVVRGLAKTLEKMTGG